jgi:hypothetical protein
MRTAMRAPRPVDFRVSLIGLFWLILYPNTVFVLGQDFDRGQNIYREACASCHGEKGIGNPDHYDSPLHGDLSLQELAKVIQETMPEGKPGSLSNEDATATAVYVHHEFYSPMAQLRNAPPRIDLTHLTVDQFRHSVMDLMAPFTGRTAKVTNDRGLDRVIHQGDWGKDRKEIEKKVDTRLNFDWGEGKPVPEVDHEKWQVRWSGSVVAPVTGTYEFYLDATIRSNLFVNDDSTPLIDASVVSFEKSLNTAQIFLVGGETYHFAVDTSRNKEKSARIAVEWKIPGGVREPIPNHCLLPTWSPRLLVCSTPFPPDDSSVGYERGRNVSREWYEANVAAAIDIGKQMTGNMKRLMPGEANDPNNAEHVRAWCYRWVTRAFRRTLTEEDKRFFIDAQFEGEPSIEKGVKKVCLLTLTSPQFLYPGIDGDIDEANVATMAMVLWDGLPEDWMIEMAQKGDVRTEDALGSLADTMMKDPRFRRKLRGFLGEFLGVRSTKELSKDAQRFPEFSPSVASDLRASLDLFLDEFANDPKLDFRQFFIADAMYLNGSLAKIYGAELPPEAPFQKVALPQQQRAGVLSHPYMMSTLAYHNTSSPIHRGVFLAKRILGRNLRPPVDAIIPITEEATPGLTTRERVALQTSGSMCQSCHRVINPLGFALESYDAMGRFRTEEMGKPIDAAGQYITSEGQSVSFQGVRETAEFIANSKEVHQSIVRQLFQSMVKQPLPAYGVDKMETLGNGFASEGYSLQPLVRKIAILSTQRPPEAAQTEGQQVSLTQP